MNKNEITLNNNKEISLLIAKARNGDEAAFSRLVAISSPAVHGQVKRVHIDGADHDDLFQEGMFSLLKAVNTYREDCGSSYKTYLNLLVSRDLRKLAKKKNRDKIEEIDFGDNEPADFTCSVSAEDGIISAERYKALIGFINSELTSKECEVLKDFLNGMPYKDVAAKLGISTKSVDSALQRARKKLLEYKKHNS